MSRVFAALACVALASGHAYAAAAWQPTRNVEIIVSTSPGSGSDATARFIHKLVTDMKLVAAPVTVVNKPGGGGTIGLIYLTQHTGNGHYLLVTSPSLLALHIMGRSAINYTDVTPLAQLGTEPVVFTVQADSAFKSGRELADRFKASPESLSFSIGTTIGSHNHIAIAQLAKAVNVNPKALKVVAFGGSAEGIAALLGGHISVVASPASGVWEHAAAGKLRMLAVSSLQRLSAPLADIPTWKELGYAVMSANWRSVVGPAGLSAEQTNYWDKVFATLSRLPAWKQSIDLEHMENTYADSRGTRALMGEQAKSMRATLTDLGLVK